MKSKAGERNGRSKLTAEEVRLIVKFLEIPRDSVHGTRDFLGRWFDVRPHTIGQIASGDRWSRDRDKAEKVVRVELFSYNNESRRE